MGVGCVVVQSSAHGKFKFQNVSFHDGFSFVLMCVLATLSILGRSHKRSTTTLP